MNKEYINIQTKESLDKEIVYKLSENAMLKHKIELIEEWDFEKNNELGLDAYNITKGSGRKAWWICKVNNEHKWFTSILERCSGRGCPYCSGNRVNDTNSLKSLYPEIANLWHPIKNGNLTPDKVTCNGSKQKVWWLGKCGHEWQRVVNNQVTETGNCPYCTNKKVLIGFNDLMTTHPHIAKKLKHEEDGYKYTYGSGIPLDWKCQDCGSTIKSRPIPVIRKRGLSCKVCSDYYSYGEKIVYNILMEANINFTLDKSTEWSENTRPDFYLPDHCTIIEVNGKHHTEDNCFSSYGKVNLTEIQKNDKFKKELAKNNDIRNYIEIDSRKPDFEWIKNSIVNSDIMTIAPSIDFDKIKELAERSFVKIISDLWNSKESHETTLDISRKTKLGGGTIRSCLKRATKLGWTKYEPNKENKSVVIQLSADGSFIKEWTTITEAGAELGLSISNITTVCRGRRNKTGGFKWMYKEDYDEFLEQLDKKS